MTNFKLLGQVDVKALQAVCARSVFQPLRAISMSLADLVSKKEPVYIKPSSGCHDCSSVLYLRYAPRLDRKTVCELESEDTVAFTRPWREAVARIAALAGLLPARAFVTKLRPLGRIERHTDIGQFFDLTDRFHLPIQTNTGARLYTGGESCHMAEGEAWYFNDHAEHFGENCGFTSRIHLIVDCWRT